MNDRPRSVYGGMKGCVNGWVGVMMEGRNDG